MSVKNFYLLLLFIAIASLLFSSGCKNTIEENPLTSVDINSTGSIRFSLSQLDKVDDAEMVDTVTVTLVRSGFESIEENIVIGNSSASGIIYNIPEGIWKITVKAKDITGKVLYSGMNQVEIKADETTYVTLELSDASSSGNLVIIVSWEKGNGIEWIEYGVNPILRLGGAGEWDDSHINNADVIYNGEKYEMWYSGSDGNVFRIGYAYSDNGLDWIKYSGNPVLDIEDVGAWSNYDLSGPSVLYDGSTYKMWFSAAENSSKGRIGYASSIDGINWDVLPDPVLQTGSSGEWDEYFVYAPTVIYNGIYYEMWYEGLDDSNYRIGYATSTDGINWSKYSGNPVLDVGSNGEWDSRHAARACVIFDGSEYKMWYSGFALTTYWQIGYASSSNGTDWTKYGGNPILNREMTGSWNTLHVLGPSVLINGTQYKMWFSGSDGVNERIGYATSP